MDYPIWKGIEKLEIKGAPTVPNRVISNIPGFMWMLPQHDYTLIQVHESASLVDFHTALLAYIEGDLDKYDELTDRF